MEEGEGIDDDLGSKRREVLYSLEMNIKVNEMFWHQKAKARWIREGDGNTKHFYKLVNGRKRKNLISSILTEGQEMMEFEEIANEATLFYNRLYRKERGSRPMIEKLFEGEISRDQGGNLERPFSEEEVKNAIFSMKWDKAPGPDGFSI